MIAWTDKGCQKKDFELRAEDVLNSERSLLKALRAIDD